MRICMFVRNPISHDPRVKREAEHLVKAGHEVTVLGTVGPGLPRRESWNGVRFRRVARLGERTIPLAWRIIGRARGPKTTEDAPQSPGVSEAAAGPASGQRQGPGRRRLLLRLGAYLSELTYRLPWALAGLCTRADVYHAHDFNTIQTAHLCAKLGRARFVYDSHELWIEWHQSGGGTPPPIVRAWTRIERRLTAAADLVITVSDGIAAELSRLYAIPTPLVVRNCAPLMPIARSDKLRRLIGGRADRPILLYQGGFVSGRGLKQLVAAADLVPSADFVLMGHDSPYKTAIEQLASACRHRNVHVLPHVAVDDLWEYTCSADVGFVLTQPVSLSYALSESNKVYEYMVAGIAVVASTIQSHRRLEKETGALALVSPSDPRDIARVVKGLLESPATMKQLAARGREWAERKYNAYTEMQKLTSACEQFARSGKAASH